MLADITLATVHVQAGECDGAVLSDRVITAVTGLRSARAQDRLEPLQHALAARRDRTCQDLARRVAAVRSVGV